MFRRTRSSTHGKAPRKPNEAWGVACEEQDFHVCLVAVTGAFPEVSTPADARGCALWLQRAADWMEYRNKRLAEKESKHG
jgi:hypothetical protein